MAQHYVHDNRQQNNDRKFQLTKQTCSRHHNFKTDKDPQAKLDEGRSHMDKINMPDYLNSSKSKTNNPDYSNSSENKEVDKRLSYAIMKRIHSELNGLFSAIGCFKATFSL